MTAWMFGGYMTPASTLSCVGMSFSRSLSSLCLWRVWVARFALPIVELESYSPSLNIHVVFEMASSLRLSMIAT